MDFGSKFVYLGNAEDDYEEVKVSEVNDVALSDSDCSDDDGETCLLDILDTAGQEEYSSVRDLYVRTGDGFVIIYSITDRKSFQEAESIFNWIKRVKEGDSHAILVANKQDLAGTDEVQVTKQEGEDLAQKLGVLFFETSAKTGEGVQNAVKGLVKVIPRVSSDYKIVMLGSGAVGKSSITMRFVGDTFMDDYDPTIEDTFRKMISVSGLKAVSKDEKKALKKKMKKKPKQVSSQAGIDSGHTSLARAQKSQRKGGVRNFLGSMFGRFTQSNNAAAQPVPQNSNYCAAGIFVDEINDSMANHEDTRAKKTRQRKVDGNSVLIPLRNLANDPNIVTGEPVRCKKCRAVLTSTGKLEGEGDNKTWICEFCGERNENLDISEDEIPKENEFDYMISPPTKPKEEEGAAQTEVENKTTPGTLVYCMDISSSMGTLCHVPESHAAWREERTRGEESVTNVTRLRCIQIAIERLAEQLKLEQPDKKVLLVVFSSNVAVKAGGPRGPVPIPITKRESFEQLLEVGLNLSNDYPLNTIEQSHEAIDQAVKNLYITGCTALGPALSICTGFVSKIPSSEIILCSDGEPNEGVGSNNDGRFYEMVGNYARSKNITINILAMEGASTGLQYVGKAAENSGGTTTKLNPVEIMRQLRLIAQNEMVATGVTVRFYLHPDFVFDEPDFPDNLSQLEKEVGSVKKETDLTFKFKVRDSTKAQHITSVPFQVQIEYTRPDGMVCLRVLSKSSEATSNRQDMEENINVSVLGASAMKTTAKMAQAGKTTEAQHMVKNFKRLVDRGAKDSRQREERAAFKQEVAQWDELLTENHDRMRGNNLQDSDAYVLNLANQASALQLQSATFKMEAVSKRKMNPTCKDAYYAYEDMY